MARRFKDTHVHKMDPKCRVAIPAEWRPGPEEKMYLIKSHKLKMQVVELATEEDFEKRIEDIEEMDRTAGEKRMLMAYLHRNSRDAVINEQGKLLIPKEWCEWGQLKPGEQVVLAGSGELIEIWSPERFEEMKEEEEKALKDALEELGVA